MKAYCSHDSLVRVFLEHMLQLQRLWIGVGALITQNRIESLGGGMVLRRMCKVAGRGWIGAARRHYARDGGDMPDGR